MSRFYAIGGNNGFAGNTDLSNNILGLNALGKRGSGAINNVAIGGNSCGGATSGATTGRDNVAIGTNALDIVTNGGYNIAVGSNAVGNLTTGFNNIGIGGNSCGGIATAATTGNDNVAIGTNALDIVTSGAYNIALGSNAMGNLTTGINNIGIGGNSCGGIATAATTGNDNVAIGTNALDVLTTGTYNIAVGSTALGNLTTGNYNIAVGSNAVGNLTTGINNIGIGGNSCGGVATAATTGNDNVAIGTNALDVLTTGTYNIALGSTSLGNLTTGNYNIAVGSNAVGNLTTGFNNIGIGGNSCGGLATAATTGNDNVAIGMNALDMLTSGKTNIAVGSTALGNLTIGGNNVAIGTNALLKVTTGGYNTAIGHNAYALNDFSYSTAIGYNSQPTKSNQIMLGTSGETVFCPGLLSVGQTVPVYELDVSGEGYFSMGVSAPQLTTDSIQYDTNLSFSSIATERMRIDINGNVGIGQTKPTSELDVSGVGNFSLGVFAPELHANDIVYDTIKGNLTFSSLDINGDATERMRIDINGNVGIGTTKPGKILDVSGDILINKMTVGLGGGSQPTNTAFGKNALKQNTTGGNNIAIGQNALTNSAIGNNNIVVGSNSSNVYNNNYCANWVGRPLTDASWARVTSGYVDDPAGDNSGNTIFVAIAYGPPATNNTATSVNGISWTRNTASFNSFWIGITYGKVNDLSATDMTYYGKSIFVAVADQGTPCVMTSTDGKTWVARTAPIGNNWFNITYGLVNGIGTFVAVGRGGSNRVITSTDGITWTSRTPYADIGWSSITYGQGRFVATASDSGSDYKTMTSIDGIIWIGNPSANDSIFWASVTYGNGLFVAVSDTSANLSAVIMTSVDGYNWIQRYSPQTASYSRWYAITYGSINNQGLFVAVANFKTGLNNVMTSVDGISWISRTAYADTSNNWAGIAYGVVNGIGRFVAISYTSNANTQAIMTSDLVIPTIPNIESNNTFIGYNTSVAYSTKNNLSWTKCVAPFSVTTPGLNSIAYGSVNGVDTFVGVLSTGTKRVAVSNDAQNWRLIDVSGINGINGTTQWRSVAYGNSRFVAVGPNRAMTSVNGITWQNIGLLATLQTSSWTDIVYGNGKFVAVADNFTNGTQIRVMTSTDGSNNWLPAGTPTTDLSSNWTSITYGNGTYIAVAKSGNGNLVMKSADGSNNWTSVNVQRSPWIHITYGLVDTSGAFVAISDQSDNVMRSMDNGSTWTYVNNVYGFNGKTVSYGLINGAGTFVAVSYDVSHSYTSLNGIAWKKYYNGMANLGLGINTIANGYVNGRSTFVAGGDRGAVYTQEQNYSNSVAIGANAQITASNQIMLGTANETVVCPNTLKATKANIGGGGNSGTATLSLTGSSSNIKLAIGDYSSTNIYGIGSISNALTFVVGGSETSPPLVKMDNTGLVTIDGTIRLRTVLESIEDLRLFSGNGISNSGSIFLAANTHVFLAGDRGSECEYARLNGTGLGIGINNPTAALDVSGIINVGYKKKLLTYAPIYSLDFPFIINNSINLDNSVFAMSPLFKFFSVTSGVNSFLTGYTYRHTVGTGQNLWVGTSTRIQQTVDLDNQAYIEFNPPNAQNGIGIYGQPNSVGSYGTGNGITVNFDGKVGIGTTIPLGALHIYEPVGTSGGGGGITGSLVIEHGNNGGCSSIIFPSSTNRTSDYGYIRYRDDVADISVNERGRLEIGTENDTENNPSVSDHLVLQKNGGYVGIGTAYPFTPLHIQGTSGTVLFLQHTAADYQGANVNIDFCNNNYLYMLARISAVDTGYGRFMSALVFSVYNNGSQYECMRITTNYHGFPLVGIGTETPSVTLDVSGTIHSIDIFCRRTISTGISCMISGYDKDTQKYSGYFEVKGCDINNTAVRLAYIGNVPFNSTTGKATGPLTIQLENDTTGVNINGTVNASAFNVQSDYRLKTNIEVLNHSKTIDDLRPVEYDLSGGKHDMGFIAHEVQDHFPFLVHGEKDGKDMQSLNYIGLIALLVKEVQDLKQSNKELKQTNTVLQQQNETFENRLQRLESLLLNQ